MTSSPALRVTCAVSSLGCGGAEKAMARLCNGLAGLGHQVVLITLNASVPDHFPIDGGVERVATPFFGAASLRWYDLAGQWRRIRQLRAAVRASRPDVVISFGDATNAAILQALTGSGLPVIVAEHTDPRGKYLGWRWETLRAVTYPRARRVVMLTESTCRWAKSRLPRWRVCAIPNGIDAPARAPIAARPTSFGRYNLLTLGRLAPEKGYDLLIGAFAELAEGFPDWNLTIFGEGEQRAVLESLISAHRLEGRVSLPGLIENPAEVLALADLFVLSSRREGFPMALLEAMAVGLPVVAFDTPSGGPAMIVRDGIDGRLVPSGDIRGLTQALAELMRDPSLRQRMGARAGEVVQRFSQDRVLAEWDALARSVVAESGVAAPVQTDFNLVCVLSSLSCGGSERAMTLLSGAFCQAGHRVGLVTLDPTAPDHFHPDERITRVAVPFFVSGRYHWFDLAGQLRRSLALRSTLAGLQPDAVVCFGDLTNVSILLALIGSGIPVIVSERTDPRAKNLGWRWELLRALAYPWASRVVMLTDATLAWAQARWPRWRACVIANGITPQAAGAAERPASFAAKNLVALGRLGPEKGFDILINAFARLAPRFPDWNLTVFGEGRERRALEQLIAERRLVGRVGLPGLIENPEAVLPLADLFVLSSRREGFPMALMEAMAAGLPAVSFATASGGPDMIVRDGIDGVLVPPEDLDALAEALERLMKDDAQRALLASRAAEVTLRFSRERMVERWLELVTAVVREKPRATRWDHFRRPRG